MIITVRIGDILAAVDTDDEHQFTPERALDYLTRCSATVLTIYAKMPDAETTEVLTAEDDDGA